MRSLSSNLIKRGSTLISQDNTRIIDVNELIAKRMEALRVQAACEEEEILLANSNSDKEQVENLLSEEGFVGLGDTAQQLFEEIPEETEEVTATPEEVLAEARKQAECILEEARRNAENEAERLHQEANLKGREEGLNEAKETLDIQLRALEEEKEELHRQYDELMLEAESKLIDILSEVYEKLIGVSFQGDKEVLLYVISNALKGIDGSHSFTVRVAPEEYETVRQKQAILENCIQGKDSYLEILSDNQLQPGGCSIETEKGIYDCSIDTQLNEIKKRLVLLSYEKA